MKEASVLVFIQTVTERSIVSVKVATMKDVGDESVGGRPARKHGFWGHAEATLMWACELPTVRRKQTLSHLK